MATFFNDKGYIVIENIITPEESVFYRTVYDNFLTGKIHKGKNKSDLGANLGDNTTTKNITQMMSRLLQGLLTGMEEVLPR